MKNGEGNQRSRVAEMKDRLSDTAGTLRGIADSLDAIAASPGVPDAGTFLSEVVHQTGLMRFTAAEELPYVCLFARDFYAQSARRIAEHAGVSNRTVSTWLAVGESAAQ